MIYVVPLFLIALMLWIERGCPRPPAIAVPAAIAAVALPVALPYTKLIGLPAVSDTPALVAIWSIAPTFGGIGNLRWVVLVCALAVCAVFLFVPRRYALVLPVLVFLYFGISQKPLEGKYRQTVDPRPLPGDHRRPPGLGRPRRRRRGGDADLVRQHGQVLRVGERVLQPEREALLLHVLAAGRRPAREAADHRSGRRS